MSATSLLLATGETIEVAGELEDVAKQVENASRSSAGTLAWLEQTSGARLAINPAHIVALQPLNE